VSSADRILRLLEQVVWSEAPLTQTELTRATGLSRSTTSQLLGDLNQLGFVDVVDRRYLAGPRLFALSTRVRQRPHLQQQLRPTLERVAGDTGETTVLAVERGGTETTAGKIFLLDFINSQHPVRLVVDAQGGPRPFYPLAQGMVILAYTGRSAAAIAAEELYKRAPDTIVDRGLIDRELEKVRRRGYAFQSDQLLEGMSSLALPVIDEGGTLVASLSVTGPTQRLVQHEQAFADAIAAALADTKLS
jgi:DNA-binding IclR family transcriptional regulator